MIHGLAVPPNDNAPVAHLVAAACGDGNIRIWDLEKVLSTFICITAGACVFLKGLRAPLYLLQTKA